jgi:hypothetical protein
MNTWRAVIVSLLLVVTVGVVAFASDYYNHGNFPSPSSPATSASMRAELDLISAGFSKLPTLTNNANKVVVVNSGATGLTTTTGQLALGGNLTITGAFNTTLAQTASITMTLPGVSGTFATLAGTETLTNKTLITPTITAPNGLISSDVGLGNVDNTSDATKNAAAATLTNKTFTAPVINGGSIASASLSGTFTGTYTLAGVPTLTSPTINTGTVGAAPTADLGIANKAYADQHGFTTGDVKLTFKIVADTGWVLAEDKSIGNASSGATGRAHADTADLYTLLWTNITDQWAPVTGGRGASAAADFAANKPLFLPKTLGRALAGYGTGTVVDSGVDADVDIAANDLSVASNNTKWLTGMPVVFTLTSGTITGLTTATTYYVVRSSNTKVELATTLANAQNGTTIDFTAKSSPVWTITHTYTARVLGEAVGEGEHAINSTELLAHSHNLTIPSGGGSTYPNGVAVGIASTATSSTGGNAAMNITQPTVFLSVLIKL